MSDTSLNKYLAQGDDAAEAAFTPNPVTGTTPDQAVVFVNNESPSSPVLKWWNGAAWIAVSGGSSSGSVIPSVCNARLTTESGVPVSTSDRTAQSTIYFTPYLGNLVALYDGAAWVYYTLSAELSLALSGLTSGKPYDVFVDYNSGSPTLELVVWTNDTTRATALATQDGIYVQTGAATKRYVGTIYTTGTTTTEDSAANRYVWNLYNRVGRTMRGPTETTDSWTYTTATWRQANANTANQLNYVVGINDMIVTADVHGIVVQSLNRNVATGVGVDSTSTNASPTWGQNVSTVADAVDNHYEGWPGVGRHFLAWLEIAQAAGTATWFGDNGGTLFQSGISGSLQN